MPKQKQTKYKFLVTVSYAPLRDKEFGVGEVHDLSDWQSKHVQTALKAGQIEEVVVVTSGADKKEE